MSRSCFCGCDSFRFKDIQDTKLAYSKAICRNCSHTLADHIPLVRSKQAD